MNPPRTACGRFADSFPCVVAVIAILNADILPFLLPEAFGCFFLAPLPLTLAAWRLLGSARCLRIWVLPTLLVLSSLLLFHDPRTDLPARRTGAELRVKAVDSSLCGGLPSWMPNAPGNVLAEVETFRYTQTDIWRPLSGTVFLRIPSFLNVSPGYGDTLHVSGMLEPLSPPAAPGVFDFSAYARTKGVKRVFEVRELTVLQRGNSFLRRIYDVRGIILESLGAKLREENRAVAAALLFGMKQGVSADIRTDFLRSGTIHVLCVSGLHIALFAMVLMAILRPFPFTARWLLVLPPVLIYALSTGMQGPAFRAYVMFAVFALLKAFHYRTRPMNTLAFAAVLLMIGNPYAPLDLGFQYSFLCVMFLILCGPYLKHISSFVRAPWRFRLHSPGWLYTRTVNFLIFSAGASFAAYLASFAVSMCHQGLFTSWAVFSYLLVSPVAWLCFALFAVGLCASWIPGALSLIGAAMSPLLDLLRGIPAFFAETGYFYTQTTPGWAALLFLILFALLLLNRKPKVELAALIGLALLAGIFLLFPRMRPDELIIRCGGGVRPMLLFTSPSGGHSLVINMPDYDAARDAAALLRIQGAATVSELYCDSLRRESCGGAFPFLNMTDTRSLQFPAPVRLNTVYAYRARKRALMLGLPMEKNQPSAFVKYRKDPDGFSLILNPPWTGIVLQFRNGADGERLELYRTGVLQKCFPIGPDREIRYEKFMLNDRHSLLRQ